MCSALVAPNGDRLYVVDATNNALYAIDNISKIVASGITVNNLSFSGPDASEAHVIYAGSPLNGPISAALLYNGNVVLGNTLDPTGNNLLVEPAPNGQVLDVENVDTGATGAIFGVTATGTTTANTKVYFNDDNDNTLKVLSD